MVKVLTMTEKANSKCSFGELLGTPCNELHFSRSVGIKDVSELDDEIREILVWRAGLREKVSDVQTLYLHHEQVIGNVYEPHASK